LVWGEKGVARGRRTLADLSPHVGSAIDMRIRCPMLGHAKRLLRISYPSGINGSFVMCQQVMSRTHASAA